MGYTIDIDTGGTFTDGFIAGGGDVRTVKVPTTPHDLTVCFLNCIEAGARAFGKNVEDFLFETDIIRFSNTIGTNAIIQRDGAKIGLIVSRGMGDLAPTDSEGSKRPLVEPEMVVEIPEEMDVEGRVVTAPDSADVLKAAQELIDKGARGIVTAFRNSEFNPENERRVRQIIKAEYPRDYLGSVSVFLASDISPRAGAEERLNSAALNAYIHGKLARLLYKAGEDLRQRQYRGTLFIGHNNGAAARVAKTRAINTYNSGPAAGLLGAREIGRLYGLDNLISTDMGGTSFDIGYVRDGQVNQSLKPDVEGFACNLPMVSILALGTGGGSIARVEDGEVKVGPQSAGALPGPASFNLGGSEATVTDANLVLGVLDPGYFLGGSMRLDMDKARDAIREKVADPLGISVEEAAWRIKEAVDRSMGQTVAEVARNLDEEEKVVVAYGGAGGLHACDIAAAAGVRKTIMTPFSAVSSAYSSSLMDVGHIYYRRAGMALSDALDAETIRPLLDAMWAEAKKDMRGEGFPAENLTAEVQLFIGPAANGAEVMLHVAEDFADSSDSLRAIESEARQRLAAMGAQSDGALKLSTIALSVAAEVPHYHLPELAGSGGDVAKAQKSKRPLYDPVKGDYVETPIYDRSKLEPDMTVFGPALVESDQTTIAVSRGWKLQLDRYANAILEEV
jgi:N-methylhydantoinase A/acetophenone carboxylase